MGLFERKSKGAVAAAVPELPPTLSFTTCRRRPSDAMWSCIDAFAQLAASVGLKRRSGKAPPASRPTTS